MPFVDDTNYFYPAGRILFDFHLYTIVGLAECSSGTSPACQP
jgi:hypothetical protein